MPDLEYDPKEYPKLLVPLLDGRADVVYGSRFAGGESKRVLYFWHSVGNRFLTTLSNMFTNINLDGHGNLLQGVPRGGDPEHTDRGGPVRFRAGGYVQGGAHGCRIYEVGIGYSGRTYAEGKKINWQDGVRAIWCILKYR